MNHKYQPIDTLAQKEALLNELKGNLFEYLVGSLMARELKIERMFIKSFGGEIRNQLTDYEAWIRIHEPELLKQLPLLASSMAKELCKVLPDKVSNILVMGKTAGGSHNESFNEADIMVICEDINYPISLKLCKDHSFVNTKSGGIKSFFSKYFSEFKDIKPIQKSINSLVDENFIAMGHELHSMAGLEFQGRFDEAWRESGLTELPGQLDEDMNRVLRQTYYSLIEKMYDAFTALYNEDKDLFIRSIYPLMGLGDINLIQATCFHKSSTKGENTQKYLLSRTHIFEGRELKEEASNVQILPLKKGISSFEVKLKNQTLQIRVKPMNKFTQAAFKVNCSLKF